MTTPIARDAGTLLATVVSLSTESWRLLRTVERFAINLDGDQQRRIIGRIKFFDQRMRDELANIGLKLVDFTGQPFGPEMAASAINAEDFGASDHCVVEQTLEPAIVGPDGLVRAGTVVLTKGR